MRPVLILFIPILFITTACQQAPAAAEEAFARAQALHNEAQGLVLVDTEDYIYDHFESDGATARATAQYRRFQNGRVEVDMALQMPRIMPRNEPFIRGFWENGQMTRAELCELSAGNSEPRCEPLAGANRVPVLRDHGTTLLQDTYQIVEPLLRQRFESRGSTAPPEPPPRVTQS